MVNAHSIGSKAEPNPYFSIIVPIYNVGAYLERCIQSVLEQNHHSYELILVDDGATDNSPEICDDYAGRFEHIRVIHKENGGLSSARNAGLEIARGQYIWWVDADDWIGPNALKILQDASAGNRPDLVKFHFFRVGRQEKEFRCNISDGLYSGPESLGRLHDKAFLEPGRFSLSAWGHIYSRSFLKKNSLSFVSERIIGSEDYLFNLCALAVAERVQVIPDALYYYRQRAGSLTQRYRKKLPETYTRLYRQLCGCYRDMGLLESFEGRICNFYAWHLIHGTCFANEYRITPEHSRKEGRRNVCGFLRCADLQYAIRHCDRERFGWKQRIELLAMQMRIEPLFYWLFVLKPRLRKERNHAN